MYHAFCVIVEFKPMKREGRIGGKWKKTCAYDWMLIEAMNRYTLEYSNFSSSFEGQKLVYKITLTKPFKLKKIQTVVDLFCEKRKLKLNRRGYYKEWMIFRLEQ